MPTPLLGYARRLAHRPRRWPIGVALAVAVVFLPVAVGLGRFAVAGRHRNSPSRSTEVNTCAMVLASVLRDYALRHDDRLPQDLEQLVTERYLSPGTFNRLRDRRFVWPVYGVDHWRGPIRFQYRGAGVSTRSQGKPVFHCDEEDYSFTYVTTGDAYHLRSVYANSRR
jgi:hypothetical protein